MWIENLRDGVVQLDSPIGPRYVRPNVVQRAYLIWMFRNFVCLPQQVLLPWERRLIDQLWSKNRFVSLAVAGAPDRPIIGKIEARVETSIGGRIGTTVDTRVRTTVPTTVPTTVRTTVHDYAGRHAPLHAEVVPIRKPAATAKTAAVEPNREAASA
jgi:hypothetical protein